MGYVNIKEASDERLHLQRQPTSRSWGILIGLVSLGLGAAYYSGDYVWWKIAYVSGSVFVGLTCMEDWEECILDKSSKKATIKRQTLIQKLFQTTEGQKIVVANLDDVISVSVQEEEVKYGGTGYIVVINFGTGYSLGVTETTDADGNKSDQEYIVDKINNFLELERKDTELVNPQVDLFSPEKSDVTMTTQAAETSSQGGIAMETEAIASLLAESESSTDDSDDGFEQIDRAELVNFDETQGHNHSNDLADSPEQMENQD